MVMNRDHTVSTNLFSVFVVMWMWSLDFPYGNTCSVSLISFNNMKTRMWMTARSCCVSLLLVLVWYISVNKAVREKPQKSIRCHTLMTRWNKQNLCVWASQYLGILLFGQNGQPCLTGFVGWQQIEEALSLFGLLTYLKCICNIHIYVIHSSFFFAGVCQYL
jgi:hypothetical protein